MTPVDYRKTSLKWQRMAEMYKRFAPQDGSMDFSERAAEDTYAWESRGAPEPDTHVNGYAYGKKYMDVTVAMWREDIAGGTLFVLELLEDGYPRWFLEHIGILHLKMNYAACKEWVRPYALDYLKNSKRSSA